MHNLEQRYRAMPQNGTAPSAFHLSALILWTSWKTASQSSQTSRHQCSLCLLTLIKMFLDVCRAFSCLHLAYRLEKKRLAQDVKSIFQCFHDGEHRMMLHMQQRTHLSIVPALVSTSEFVPRHTAGDEKVIISEGFRSAKLIRSQDGS